MKKIIKIIINSNGCERTVLVVNFFSISNVSRHVYRLIMFYVLLLIFLTQQDKTIDKLKRNKNNNKKKKYQPNQTKPN